MISLYILSLFLLIFIFLLKPVFNYSQPESEPETGVLATLGYMTDLRNYFQEENQEHYLSAMGLYVVPAFRGEGVGYELLKTR